MLILNHIGHSFFDFFNGDVDHVRKVMETNFLSYVAMTVSALPMLKESEGSIVVISSVAGEHMSACLSLPRAFPTHLCACIAISAILQAYLHDHTLYTHLPYTGIYAGKREQCSSQQRSLMPRAAL